MTSLKEVLWTDARNIHVRFSKDPVTLIFSGKEKKNLWTAQGQLKELMYSILQIMLVSQNFVACSFEKYLLMSENRSVLNLEKLVLKKGQDII